MVNNEDPLAHLQEQIDRQEPELAKALETLAAMDADLLKLEEPMNIIVTAGKEIQAQIEILGSQLFDFNEKLEKSSVPWRALTARRNYVQENINALAAAIQGCKDLLGYKPED